MPETPNKSWTPEQRISIQEALDAYTVAVAAQLKLTIKNSDLVILSGNPLTEDLLKLEVTETIVAGKTVYASK
jgi:predicted amidohydrolase YtcJ